MEYFLPKSSTILFLWMNQTLSLNDLILLPIKLDGGEESVMILFINSYPIKRKGIHL